MEFKGKTILIEGRNSVDSWARAIKIIAQQREEIISGEDYEGNAKYTKEATGLICLDEDAVEDILAGIVHPNFSMKKQSLEKYNEEFTYKCVKDGWELPTIKKFDYTYMGRLINYPIPLTYIYMGDLIELNIDEKYLCRTKEGSLTGGLDQLKVLHDSIRRDGISRRHQLILFIPAIDDFSKNPVCLQRIWMRILVPKDEYYKYKQIPVEVHIEYRSWDLINGMPANLYALLSMLQRYIFGNLTEESEYKNEELNKYNKVDFKIARLILFGNSIHIYEDSYDFVNKVS